MKMRLSNAVLLYWLAVSLVHHSSAVKRDCTRISSGGVGNGVLVNATCHLNGTIEYMASLRTASDGFQIDYNCTGSQQSYHDSTQWSSSRIQSGKFVIDNWDYNNSVCFFGGCYADLNDHGFRTFSLSSTTCTVIVPSSVQVEATSSIASSTSLESTPIGLGLLGTPPGLLGTPPHGDEAQVMKNIVVIASVTALVAVVLGVMLLALVFIIRSSGRHKRRSYMHTLMIDTKQNQINAEDKGDQFDLNNLRNLKVLVMEINSSMETIPDCLCSDKEEERYTRLDSQGSIIIGSSSITSNSDTFPESSQEDPIGMYHVDTSGYSSALTSGQTTSEYIFGHCNSIPKPSSSTGTLNLDGDCDEEVGQTHDTDTKEFKHTGDGGVHQTHSQDSDPQKVCGDSEHRLAHGNGESSQTDETDCFEQQFSGHADSTDFSIIGSDGYVDCYDLSNIVSKPE